MIALVELRARAVRKYAQWLSAHLLLTDADFFPLPIPANKTLDRSGGPAKLLAQQIELIRQSKNKTGVGYELEVKPNPKTGQSEIRRIYFPAADDLLHFLAKTDEFAAFARDAALIRAEFSELLPRLARTPHRVVEEAGNWPKLLAVCRFFRVTPQPEQFVRSLAIEGLDSKFVERNQGMLRVLLDEIIPAHLRRDEPNFFRRFHLHQEEASVRVRFLDERLRLHPALSQLTVWVSEFRALALAGRRVFIIENLTSFLAFPAAADSLALWGGGFAVSQLANVPWLTQKEIWYWGDIDIHGLQIFAQVRAAYPAARSLLMDRATLRRYGQGGCGADYRPTALPQLTADEQVLYQELLISNERLEQEQIPQHVVLYWLSQ